MALHAPPRTRAREAQSYREFAPPPTLIRPPLDQHHKGRGSSRELDATAQDSKRNREEEPQEVLPRNGRPRALEWE